MQKMLEVEIWTIIRTEQGNVVLLRPLGTDISVPIFVAPLEAKPILVGLGGASFPQPPIHELFVEIVNRVGLKLLHTEVYDIKNNVFLARLCFDGAPPGSPFILDSRPSDAIALALRCKCPILVAKKVITATGVPVDVFLNAPGENPAFPSESKLEEQSEISEKNLRRLALQTELEGAVSQEDYERAAKLRDALLLLDNDMDPEGPRTP
ncbi:MAG: bifunctional nuclease family protein [Spirochaetaceae bacterium]|jgi:bifunctional DNase/RNase|nr:bifunctional nuclease family protein [Spirochaetaceae bacterium]